ncbi:hypothetical protein Tco_0449306 [Tanacetum coccineum]
MPWLLTMELEGSSSSLDSEVDSCSKSCVKAYATLKEQYDSFTSDYKRSQFNLVSYKAVKLRDTALVENKKKLEKAEKERDELKLTLENFQNSSKSLNNLLESQVIDKFKTGLGYNSASSTAASPVVESFVNSSEMLENQENNKSKSDKGYHAVPPPFTGNFIPFKPDLTLMDEIVESENMDVTTIVTPSNVKKVKSNHESAGVKSNGDAVEPKTVRKNNFRPPVIEDWNSNDDLDEEDASKQGRERETVHTATTRVSVVSAPVTTAGTLIKMKEEKAKEKGVAIKDVEDSPRPIRSITTLQPLLTIDPKDKGKGVLVEEEPEKPEKVKRRDQGLAQIESDAELAQRLHEEELAELDRAQKERQKQEEATSAALAEEFDEIQARIDADHELAVRLTHEEQEKYTIKERARLLAEFFERRKKQLAAERAEAIRNKPPTRTQVRNMMITYLKHMGKYTHQQLKHKNFEEVQKLYEREKKWIDDFKPIDDDSQQQAESTKKRPRADSEEESSKKQKLEEDNDAEKEELRDSMDVVPRDDVAIDVESLATKYPIVDWKTHILNENMMYYQIIRADGSSKNYKIFSEMLDDFDRQDVIDLHRLVNERYEITSLEGYDLLLWGDLKTLFEPNEEDEIWKNQQDYNLISWRLFDSCGVHVLLMNTGVAIHMMIEKKYPLTQEMLSRMLNRRLEVDYESEMAFELLRFTRSQLQK